MDLINQLMGVVVLTSPMWLMILLFIAAVWIGSKASERFRSRAARTAAGCAVAGLVLIAPFGDEILGHVYFQYLCATAAGVKVYRTVELPKDYWDATGKPTFYDERNGNFVLKNYRIEYADGSYSRFFHIDNAGYARIDGSGQKLGEVVDFSYWGGWVRRNLTPHDTANACKDRAERSNRLISQIFKKRS